ncbi:unnamed protein product [Schistosoma mattheei]|uniref:Uncharacterized protein n=1 Tax=Schistosoma mattheei TaxID=31246 RepID=A0A3P8F913_9TREM|nr:unnamed protein product [Schistosoma mattheei]
MLILQVVGLPIIVAVDEPFDDALCRSTKSVRPEIRKLSGNRLTPPNGSCVRFRHNGQVKSR